MRKPTWPIAWSRCARRTYPRLEVLVVDDRSRDRTGEIARWFAARDQRVRVLSIDELPPGWTGKTHALYRAAAMAAGEWLWFLDADTLHAPESLAIVMEYAAQARRRAREPLARAAV